MSGALKPESAQTSFPSRLDPLVAPRESLQLLRQSADRLSLRECAGGSRGRQTQSSSWARPRLYSCPYRSWSASPSSPARLCRRDTRATPDPKTITPLLTRSTFLQAADL